MSEPAPYGYCPTCRSRGVSRERRPGGDDTCRKGHVYPSAKALKSHEVKRLDADAIEAWPK